MRYFFVRPVDVVMLRGNKLFGEAGSYGDVVVPPWPSVFAGAFRSYLWNTLSANKRRQIIGDPRIWGTFRLRWLSVGRIHGTELDSMLVPLPSDVVVLMEEGKAVGILKPKTIDRGSITSSSVLPMHMVASTSAPGKTTNQGLISSAGVKKWQESRRGIEVSQVGQIFMSDTRLGIGMNVDSRTASEGALYTSDSVTMREGYGFLVGICGEEGFLPKKGLLRLGGDGRGAEFLEVKAKEQVDLATRPSELLRNSDRLKIAAVTPLIFEDGWIPDGVRQQDNDYVLELEGFSARLVSVALKRYETISGWDMANRRPKLARRAVPPGSVYFFDRCEGNKETFYKWCRGGMRDMRRNEGLRSTEIEGFNTVVVGLWRDKE